jgi:hypothetical protein
MVSEGTGGLTELIKGRVLLPHTGSWDRLRWVTRHELAHSYMLEKIARVMKLNRRNQGYLPPLWFIEGLAEYIGTTWDADAEGLLRDAVLNGQARRLTRSDDILGTVLMYKEGQSFLLWLAGEYGDARIFDLFDNWHRADDFETAFRITFGRTVEDADAAWFASVRRRYYPAVAERSAAPDVAVRVTPHGSYNLGTRALPGAGPADTALRVCFFAASEGGVDLVIREPGRNGRPRETRVLRGGQSPWFESFHLFQNRPDASPSGLIALSSKHGGRDALYLVDGRRRRVVRRLDFPRLVAINDPAIVPGDSAVVFSAQDYGGRSDLYRASWPGGRPRLERLTRDDFDDVEPDVSPDGRWVAFASDRCDRGGRYSLFRLSLDGGAIEKLSDPPAGDDRQPVYSPDGRWIAFRSTRAGSSDLYLRPPEPAREARRVTRLIGPAYDPDWIPSGDGLLFTGQNGIRFQGYRIAVRPESLAVEPESPAAPDPVLPAAVFAGDPSPYQRRLGLDLASNAISLDPGLSSPSGGGQVALSDVLGNEQIYVFLANDSERFGGFWDGFEVALTYVNRAQRLNWGAGLFRLTEVYDADLNEIRREKRYGVLGLASFPLSKFTRIEGSVLARRAEDHRLRSGVTRDVDLVSNLLAVVHDNTRWTMMGPSGGLRLYVGAGFTRDLTEGAGDFAILQAEARHYDMPLPSLVLALRAQGQTSVWRDAQRFYLGGWSSLRGFDRRTLVGEQTLLLQAETRFPLLRGLTLAVPALWTFPTISGALFADGAWLWEDLGPGGDAFSQLFERRPGARAGSLGAGFYLGGGYYPALRWDYVWTAPEFGSLSRRPRTQFSILYNF